MGCTQSKIENEEAVNRCKDRKRLMKDAVGARNAFAAAHSAHAMALKNTGAALSDYAHGEVQHPHLPLSSSSSATAALPSSASTSTYETLPPPPPPPPNFPPAAPLQRAASMPEISGHKPDPKRADPIIEDEEEGEIENESHSLKHRVSRISGGGGSRVGVTEDLPPQPPSPPRTPPLNSRVVPPPPPPPESKGMSSWDFFFPEMENVPGPSLAAVDEVDEGRFEREEMERQLNEDRRAKREEVERKMIEEQQAKRGEMERRMNERADAVFDGGDGGRGGRRKSGKAEAAEVAEKADEAELPPQPPPPTKAAKRVKQVVPTESKRGGKGVVPNVSLVKIFGDLDDCFLRASESAHEVSKMLEAHRLHYHSNFADNRGHIDHSARVMRVITWNRSFSGLTNAEDGKDELDSEEHETHATVLDKMLAWEKKLYDEVKTGEQMKFEYQRKVTSLNKLKNRNASTETIEKTKAALSHLHTRYIVDMQSMDSTVSEINRLRDDQLYPKLVALVDGMATMWENMKIEHQNQSKIVMALKYLDISQCPKETSGRHHKHTDQLWAVAREWHSQFGKLMSHQKEYIKALKSWLDLNLVPMDNNLKEKVSSPQRPQNPPIQSLLHAWHDFLEKLPDEQAKTAIHNFSAVIETILQYQMEELELRAKCEETRKDLNRKTRQYEDWYNKYMQRRTPPDEIDPDRAHDKDLITERQIAVETVRKKLEEEEDAYEKQCTQVRQKSLNTLRSRLPELFKEMADFSVVCSDMYRRLRSISQLRKPSESS
ncbi:protein ALTERED PHOSPHATE STARVATION RESPONSE 1-like [Rhododendron vialii]|uniref:protein ALTERED PHOSPHATE STARVATION RESPONSE 1-like n=1 Tax=Rhododendron vialii TaxID=182163 RepID=UPI00265DEA59|nr:protein ALTERED PHOSPHATE STARVATION RESPONSE 1-like [Rhododendron vialii]